MRLRIFGLGLMLLAGCQTLPPRGDAPAGNCGAALMQSLVGQPAGVLAAMKFAPPTRIIRPGDAVTEDYSPSRLNIEIDLHETIAAVRCG